MSEQHRPDCAFHNVPAGSWKCTCGAWKRNAAATEKAWRDHQPVQPKETQQ